MKCCVSCCENTSGNVSTASGITFHVIPYEVYHRIAWLRALGKEEYELPACSVVCSQHFLDEDFSEANCGLRELQTDAVPLLLQVCLICLDTDCKLYTLGKCNLETAYENLSKHMFYDNEDMPRTVCGECRQRLVNYSKFRDKSRKAHSLLTELLKKHEVLTIQNVKSIDREVNQLNSNLVRNIFEPDHFDLYMQESTEQVIGSGSNYTIYKVATNVKAEHEESNDESQEDQSDEEFEDYTSDIDDPDVSNLDRSRYNLRSGSVNIKVEKEVLEVGDTTFHDPNMVQIEPYQNENVQDMTSTSYADRWPVVKVEYDSQTDSTEVTDTPFEGDKDKKMDPLLLDRMFEKKKLPHTSSQKERDSDILKNVSTIDEYGDTTSKTKIKINNITSTAIKIENTSESSSEEYKKSCKINDNTLKTKSSGETHNHETKVQIKIEPINDKKQYTCDNCQKTFVKDANVSVHMKTHMAEKPFVCGICNARYKQKENFIIHMKTHTGDRAYTCNTCHDKFTVRSYLDSYINPYIAEKTHSFKVCSQKFSHRNSMLTPVMTHTGEKRHTCPICDLKLIRKSQLVQHIQTHKIEKPFVCSVCDRRFSYRSTLMMHMKMHTGDTPFACDCCKEKFTAKGNLAKHVKTHASDTPK